MQIIGLCGGSGSGKGAVSEFLSLYGVKTIDTDAVYHDITSHRTECVDEVALAFGDEVINPDGSLNRKELAKIVFSGEDAEKRRQLLNKISHKHVWDKTKELITDYENNGAKFVLIDAPLLFESGFNENCDYTVAVTADIDIRIERIIKRDGIDRNAAIMRIKSQLSDEYLIKHADYHLENSRSLDELKEQVKNLALKLEIIK